MTAFLSEPWNIVCLFTAAAIILSIIAVGIATRSAHKAEDEAYRWNDHQ